MYDAATGEHIYLSTACLHDWHRLCRLRCKWCLESCLCLCHYQRKGTVMTTPENPQPLDNPATPDADVDQQPAAAEPEAAPDQPDAEPATEVAVPPDDDEPDDGVPVGDDQPGQDAPTDQPTEG